MGAMSNYLEAALLNEVFRGVAYTSPAAVYLALYTADPTDADSGTEVSGGAYARQAVTFGAPSQVGSAATIANTADINFPVATASWGTITHIGIRDALTNGNLLYYGPIATSKLIDIGDRMVFLTGDLKLTLD